MEIFLRIPYALLRLLNYSPSGLWLLRAESSRAQERKPVDHPDGQGTRRISPHQAAAPGSGEILNRAPGNNSTLDDFPPSLGSILKSDRAVHNPPPSTAGLEQTPDPRWNASESPQHRP